LRIALAAKVGEERFELWFGRAARLELNDRRLIVAAPNKFFLDWIRSNFRRELDATCREVLGTCLELTFRVDAALPVPDSGAPAATAANGANGQKLVSNQLSLTANTVTKEPEQGRGQKPSRGDRPRGRTFRTLESFVSGSGNRLALASAEMAARRPGHLTPLLVHGPTSVGKSHLLEGIFTLARKSRRSMSTVYLSAEQFTTQFLAALHGSGLPNFRRKYRGVELLILDDLHFLAGKRATQIELLHTVDTLLRDEKQLVFSADRPPEELAALGPELITRLQSGMVCCIEPADHATRLGIVGQMARRLRVNVPPDVQHFVASRLTSHARELSGALCRLHATSQALGRPITLPLAEEALAEMIRHSSRAVRLDDIEKAVCDAFGLQPASLQSGGKTKRITHPRMLAMWLARKHTRAALSEIGHFFGRRSHSTVISAQRRIDHWMADGRTLAMADDVCDVDEAIRRVERQLRAG
jgi:chromosomal replication initiator protein